MLHREKRVLAARKAANTLRVNLLAKVNIKKVRKLCEEIQAKEYEIDDDISRQGIIAKEVGKTTYKSFCRFGDRKGITKALILSWIDNNGISLDEQAFWICENYGIDIQPSELAEFMMQNDRGEGHV